MSEEKRYQAYNKVTGREVAGTADWIPGNCLIQGGSWSIDEKGDLSFEHAGETEMCWDGCVTETNRGYTVYLDEGGEQFDERDIVLVEVDENDVPIHKTEDGEVDFEKAVAIKPQHMTSTFNDNGVWVSMRDLLHSAYAVVDNWESGDLAGAVNNMEGAAETLRQALGWERPVDEDEDIDTSDMDEDIDTSDMDENIDTSDIPEVGREFFASAKLKRVRPVKPEE